VVGVAVFVLGEKLQRLTNNLNLVKNQYETRNFFLFK